MRVKHVHRKSMRKGKLPKPGELFSALPSGAVYVAVDMEAVDMRGVKGACAAFATAPLLDSGEVALTDGVILGISLESGRPHVLPVNTTRRSGFIILEPDGGSLGAVRKEPQQESR